MSINWRLVQQMRLARVVAVVLVLAVFAAGCSTSGHAEDDVLASAGDIAPAGESVASLDDVGTVYSGTASDDIEFEVEAVSYEGPTPEGLTISAMGLSVHASETVNGFVEMRLTLPDAPSDEALPIVVHVTDDGDILLEPGLWDPDRNEIIVLANEFSDRFGGWWNPLNWGEEAIQAVQGAWDYAADFVTGHTDPPGCRDDSSWMTAAKQELASVHVCVQANQDGNGERSEALLKSNRRTMQLVTRPTGADFVWTEDDEFLASVLAPYFGAGRDVLLLRGDMSTSFGIRQPEFDTDVEVRAYQSWQIIVANGVLSVLGNLWADELLGATITAFYCASDVGGTDYAAADLMPDGIRDLSRAVEVAVRCAIEILASQILADGVVDEFVQLVNMPDELARTVSTRAKAGLKRIRPTAARLDLALKAIAIGSVVTNVWDSAFDNIAEGRLTLSMRGHGGDAAAVGLGKWRPSCQDVEQDWNQLYRNVALRAPFTDTSRLWSENPEWGPDVREAVVPLARCGEDYLQRLADHIVQEWADLDPAGAQVVADAIGAVQSGSDSSGGRCTSTGRSEQGRISGVLEWARMRSAPSISASEVAKVDAGVTVTFFRESETYADELAWFEIMADGRCGWMAGIFVTGPDGSVIGYHNPVAYVNRVLNNLEPESMHATEIPNDPAVQGDFAPFDDSILRPAMDQLQQLERTRGPLEVQPDRSYEGNGEGVGCFISDFLHCRVLLYDPGSQLVAVVYVDYVGDGVTDLAIE